MISLIRRYEYRYLVYNFAKCLSEFNGANSPLFVVITHIIFVQPCELMFKI